MLTDNQILKLITDWSRIYLKKDLKPRYLVNDLKKFIGKEVIDLIGVRRSGKSSILFLIMQTLKLKPEELIYINFEDPLFINDYSVDLLERIWNIYRININNDKKPYLFFDEIQYIPLWEKWIRKIRDLEQAYVFVTGSSSSLLSREYGTSLTGRHLSFRIFPLSFKEFIEFKDEKIPKKEFEIISKNIKFKSLFKKYLKTGGFPEAILTHNLEILKEYFEDILYRDIVIRHNIRDVNSLRRLALFLFSNISCIVSYNSLKKTFSLSLDTVRTYLSYLEESYLLFQVPLYSHSLKVQEYSPKKIYSIDIGLRNVVSFSFSPDMGKVYENLVFLELKRQNKDIFYWKNKKGKEVDFLIRKGITVQELIQVCYDLKNKKTWKREIESLIDGLKQFKLKKGTIITYDYDNEETIENKKIRFVPLWKWLLE